MLTGYGYDAVSRLTGLTHDLTGSAGDVSWGLGYNPASQIVAQTRNNDAYAFTGYVTASKSYAVNGLNQYTAVDAAGLTYDLNGNLTSDGTTGYSYDVENRLIASSSGATLSYDPAGRLWQMTMGTSTVRFLYDGNQLLEERDGGGTLLRRYVHGNDEDDPLLWYEGSGLSDRRSFQVDHQGSITSIANADGTLRTIDSYDEYGLPGGLNDGRFQYTGQAWLPALGLYYYKARIYSPKLGRFLQTDPIGYKDQVNLYAYVANDPINYIDPSGLRLAGGVVVEGSEQCTDSSHCAADADITVFGNRPQSPSGGGSGGRGDAGPRDSGWGKSPQSEGGPCSSESALGRWSERLEKLSEYSSDGALVSGAAALVTSETIVGGIGFGAAAGVLETVSQVSSGAATLLKALDGNGRGAAVGAASFAVGFLLPKGLQKLAPAEGGFAGEAGAKFNEYVAGAEGSAAERLTGALGCH